MIKLEVWNMVFTVVNLLVFFLLVRRFLFKPVLDIIAARELALQTRVDNAEKKLEEANSLHEQYEKELENAKEDGMRIVTEAKDKAHNEYDRIVKDAQEKASEIVRDAQVLAKNEKERSLQEAQSEITSLAVEAAARIVGAHSNATLDNELYNQFLTKVGENN
ncbi:MAG: F0F1 ATP synthase subunit B [Lachnospiraceae bacterium]|nr:F0F1 ATP synthase subunit B [Lachnospiraceae bacterium]